MLRKHKDITVEVVNTAGALGVLRFNHLHPPFDNPAIRRAVFPAIDQKSFMQAALGEDPALWQVPAGAFTPGTPLANEAGLEALTRAARPGRGEAGVAGGGLRRPQGGDAGAD